MIEVVLAGFLTVLGQVRPPRQIPERCRVGAYHQADDLVGSLSIKPMLAVERRLYAHPGVILRHPHQALGSVDQNVVGEVGADMQEGQRSKRVDSVFLTAEHGQVELADHRVTKFMTQREHSIAGHEFDNPLTLSLVKMSRGRMSQCKRAASLRYPRPDAILRAGWVPGRRHESAGHEHAV